MLPLYVYHARQDDPKKCSARRMQKFGLATLYEAINKLPSGAILLSPLAGRALSPGDEKYARRGIVVLDCTWGEVERIFPKLRPKHMEERALPYLLAANPVNYGKPFMLNSAEACVAALYILGRREQALEVAGRFRWGETFLALNREPLEAYAGAKGSADVVALQREFMPE
jgi:pre-rRNA-processing protein TSR3